MSRHTGVISSKLLEFRWSEPQIILGFVPSRRAVHIAFVDDPLRRATVSIQHLKHASLSQNQAQELRVRYLGLVDECREKR